MTHHPIALAVLFTAALPSAAAATTWYISGTGSDSNSGTTLEAPFGTLQHAADLTSPGDTVMVLNGTYVVPCKGCEVLGIYHSGTAAAPITYAIRFRRLITQWAHLLVKGIPISH
jgi:hypothetical protein